MPPGFPLAHFQYVSDVIRAVAIEQNDSLPGTDAQHTAQVMSLAAAQPGFLAGFEYRGRKNAVYSQGKLPVP